MTVFDPQQLAPVELPAAGFHPQLAGLNRRHQQLNGAGAVHFLAHDDFQLFQRAKAEREIGINARGDFSQHPAANHQLLTDDVGISRVFAEGVQKVLGPAHKRGEF